MRIGQPREPDNDPRHRAQGERALVLRGRAQKPDEAGDRAGGAADHAPLQNRKAGLEAPPVTPAAEPRQHRGQPAQEDRDGTQEDQEPGDVEQPRVGWLK